MARAQSRYVTDVPYIADFTAELSPDWLDLVATVGGFVSPRRGSEFAWCELGCGHGLATVINAAANAGAAFVGIDISRAHIASAKRLAARAGVKNASFHARDFAAAVGLNFPQFDYIVAHGVYAWIDAAAGDAFRRFIDRHLAPGGLVYVSYNAMPGWMSDAPFQHLVRSFAEAEPGDSNARFKTAAEKIMRLTAAGAPALRAGPIARDWARHSVERAPPYYAHEYLAPGWRPYYVDEVRSAMAAIGLSPVGSATLADNFDSLVLTAAARVALERIADPDLRELARDYFMAQRFRRDVFCRRPRMLTDAQRRKRLLSRQLALLSPPALVEYGMTTEAGRVDFDNPVARRLIAAFAGGPRSLADCAREGMDEQDVLANGLTLCCAGLLWPTVATPLETERLNAALFEMPGEKDRYGFRALSCGTALRLSRGVLEALHRGKPLKPEARLWRRFLRTSA